MTHQEHWQGREITLTVITRNARGTASNNVEGVAVIFNDVGVTLKSVNKEVFFPMHVIVHVQPKSE